MSDKTGITGAVDNAQRTADIINSLIDTPEKKVKYRCSTKYGVCLRIKGVQYTGYELTEKVLEDTSFLLVQSGHPLALWSYSKDGRGIKASLIFDVYESLSPAGVEMEKILNR